MNGYRQYLAGNLAPIAIEFFVAFSRFEFALKRGEYLLGQEGNKAGPDWNSFGGDLGEPFFNDIRDAKGAEVFFREPPRRLTVKVGGGVEFSDQAPIVNAQKLFESVGLVRNNLFHGEKAYIGQRDEELLTASLFVLDSAFAAASQREDMRGFCQAFFHAPINEH
jgi:hypothetical protein